MRARFARVSFFPPFALRPNSTKRAQKSTKHTQTSAVFYKHGKTEEKRRKNVTAQAVFFFTFSSLFLRFVFTFPSLFIHFSFTFSNPHGRERFRTRRTARGFALRGQAGPAEMQLGNLNGPQLGND